MRKFDASLIKQAKSFRIPSSYGVGGSAIISLAEMYDNNLLNGFNHIYRMGFIKGQRSEKNARKSTT